MPHGPGCNQALNGESQPDLRFAQSQRPGLPAIPPPLLPSPCFLSPRPSIVRFHWDFNTMSAPSLAPYIIKRPWLQRFLMPLAKWYTDAAGYRRLGLK